MGIGVTRDIDDGKIVRHKRIGETAERNRDKYKLPLGRRAGHRHEARVAGVRADQRQGGLNQRDAQRHD